MSRISQCRMSPEMKKTFSFFMKKYNLKAIVDRHKPAIYFGLYSTDVRKLDRHKSLVVAVWMGTDILMPGHVEIAKKLKNVKHVAISSFMSADLEAAGLPYKFLPLSGSDHSLFSACPKGNEIYTYIPEARWLFYGGPVVEKLQKICPYKINIISSSSLYSRKKIRKIYKRCFLGLRLTPHDGVAHTVAELGLMGRRCIYNGEVPGSIPWLKDDVGAIADHINKEAQQIGKTDNKLADEWAKFMDVGTEWLQEDYWK